MNDSASIADGIDVIVRFHDPLRLVELDRALFSLLNQRFRQVRPIVVTQGFDEATLSRTRDLALRHGWEDCGQRLPTVVNVPNDEGRDLRSRLLNVGVENLDSRYMAILDSDDYLYGNAFECLVNELEKTNAAIAFASVNRKDVRIFDKYVYSRKYVREPFRGSGLKNMAVDNFCPIHSFAIDRSKIDQAEIRFDENISRLEDYEFLLRICARYPSSFNRLGVVIGIYNWHLDGRASNQFAEDHEKATRNRAEWNRARRRVWHLKCQLRDKLREQEVIPR